jgi:hypothetical protein
MQNNQNQNIQAQVHGGDEENSQFNRPPQQRQRQYQKASIFGRNAVLVGDKRSTGLQEVARDKEIVADHFRLQRRRRQQVINDEYQRELEAIGRELEAANDDETAPVVLVPATPAHVQAPVQAPIEAIHLQEAENDADEEQDEPEPAPAVLAPATPAHVPAPIQAPIEAFHQQEVEDDAEEEVELATVVPTTAPVARVPAPRKAPPRRSKRLLEKEAASALPRRSSRLSQKARVDYKL